jgi:uncharacterized membrane protein
LEFSRRIYYIILILSGIWCAIIFAAPLLVHNNYQGYAFFIYKSFSRICHQIPERSFHIFNEKFAVCERCFSIYFSFFTGVIIFPFLKKIFKNRIPSNLFIIIPLIILMLDFIFGIIGFLQNEYTVIVSGSIFGLFISYFMVYGLLESVKSFQKI